MEHWLAGFFSDYGVWATFIAAAIGFTGVALTIAFQHQGDVALAADAETRERQRIIAAFIAELRGMESYAREAKKSLSEWGQTDFLFPVQSVIPLFAALAPRIYLLTPIEISKIVGCYVWESEVPRRLALLAGSNHQPQALWVPVKAEHMHVAITLIGQLEKLAADAVSVLSNDAAQ